MVTKEGVFGTKLFYWSPFYGIRSCHTSFHHFSQCFYIGEMLAKASNIMQKLVQGDENSGRPIFNFMSTITQQMEYSNIFEAKMMYLKKKINLPLFR